MSFGRYLKEKTVLIVIFACALVLVTFGLWAFDTHIVAMAFTDLTMVVALAIGLIYDYSRRRTFLSELVETSQALEKKYLLPELIERPSFYEGEIYYDVLAAAAKSMTDEVALHRNSAEEYREYIETWIHEIKTPIAASKLIIENGKEGLSPNSLKALDEEQNRIEALVEQALFYARSNALEKDYVVREIELASFVKGVVKKHSRALIEAKVTPTFDNLGYSVFCDQKWLDFVIGQLISNSLRYRRESGATLAFSASKEDGHVYLHIEDNGIGIARADLSRVFEKGFTGEHGRNFAKTTGIGLYLCKKMCEKMGLRIGIESTQASEEGADSGTTVTIDFPENRMQLDALGS